MRQKKEEYRKSLTEKSLLGYISRLWNTRKIRVPFQKNMKNKKNSAKNASPNGGAATTETPRFSSRAVLMQHDSIGDLVKKIEALEAAYKKAFKKTSKDSELVVSSTFSPVIGGGYRELDTLVLLYNPSVVGKADLEWFKKAL